MWNWFHIYHTLRSDNMHTVAKFTSATTKLVLHVIQFATLTEAEFEAAFDVVVHLLELANDERYRCRKEGAE